MQVCFLNSERKKLIQFQMYVGNSYNAWEKITKNDTERNEMNGDLIA